MTVYTIEYTTRKGRARRAFPAKHLAIKFAAKRYGDTCGSILIRTYHNAPDDLFDDDDVAALIWTRQHEPDVVGEITF